MLNIWVFNVVLDKNVFDEMEHRPFATSIHRVRFLLVRLFFKPTVALFSVATLGGVEK